MSTTISLHVEVFGVLSINMTHYLRKIASRCLKQHVVMIGHQTVHMNFGLVALDGGMQIEKKLLPVSIVLKYVLPLITPRGNVVKGSGISILNGLAMLAYSLYKYFCPLLCQMCRPDPSSPLRPVLGLFQWP